MIFLITGASGSRQTSFPFFREAITCTSGHCWPLAITFRSAIIAGEMPGVMVKQMQRNSLTTDVSESASASSVGGISSNRNPSSTNSELEGPGMRAERWDRRLIADRELRFKGSWRSVEIWGSQSTDFLKPSELLLSAFPSPLPPGKKLKLGGAPGGGKSLDLGISIWVISTVELKLWWLLGRWDDSWRRCLWPSLTTLFQSLRLP